MVSFKTLKNKNRFWAGLLFAQFLLFYILSKTQFGVNLFSNLFETKKYFHQKLFSTFNFSIGDLFYIFIFLYLFFCLYKLFKKNDRKKYFIKIFKTLNFFYLIYQISWGMLYFQTPLIDKLPEKQISEKEIKKKALEYIEKCNESRKQVKEDKNGVFIITNIEETKMSVLNAQQKIPKEFSNKKNTHIQNFKPTLFGKYFSYTGILGYYNPFTSEAQYNANLPYSYLPFTLAHESAHQLGFAREQEANFIAYLICKNSDDTNLIYSSNLYVARSLLNSLIEKDPKFVEQAKLKFSKDVKRDLENNKNFIKEHQSWVDDAIYFTNDLFLKSNRQEGSITYSYFLELLLRYEN